MNIGKSAIVFGVAAVVAFSSGSLVAQTRGGGGGGKGGSGTGSASDPRTLGGQLKFTASTYYNIYTDLEEQDAKEASLRMTKMAEEYNERTRTLFRGKIGGKLPFYLYAKGDDYYKAGGMAGSAGVFNGEALMAMTIRNKEGRVGPGTWHVVQHEGFHQFVDAVIRGEIPIWANEGLAEYFGESVFTGDGMVTGVIPAGRLARLKQTINAPGFKGLKQMMEMSHAEWNAAFGAKNAAGGGGGPGANYDTAWAMVHFMAHADNGKYQVPFSNFLVQMGNGKNWERAWNTNFGSDAGFEKKWREYWLNMPDNPTADLYAKAVVATMTSFIGRAASQKQSFESFEQFIATDAKDLKAATADWLPPALFTEMKGQVGPLKNLGCTFSLVQVKGKTPTVECVMGDGSKFAGTYSSGNKVKVEFTKAPVAKPAAPVKSH